MNFDLFEALAELEARFGGEVSVEFSKHKRDYKLTLRLYREPALLKVSHSMPTSGFMQPTNHSPTRGDVLRIMFHKLVQKLDKEIDNGSV